MTRTEEVEDTIDAELTSNYEGIYHHVKRRKVMISLFDSLTKGQSNLTILDIGCGDGWYTQPLANRNHRVVGIDLSRASLLLAKRRARKADFIVAEAKSVPFQDHTFNIVIAAEFLEHLEDPLQAVLILDHLTKRKGLVFVEVPSLSNLVDHVIMKLFNRKSSWGLTIDSTHRHFFDEGELRRLFLKCELEPVDVVGAVHLSYDLPMMSSIVWDRRKRFWPLLDVIDQFLEMLKREWGSIQIYVLQKKHFKLDQTA